MSLYVNNGQSPLDSAGLSSAGHEAIDHTAAPFNLTDEAAHDALDHTGLTGVGRVLQVAYVSTGTDITDTVGIPVDATIPQITEGTQALSLAFTPVSATSELHFEIVTHIGYLLGGGGHAVTALFVVGTSDALAVADQNDTNAGVQSVKLMHRIAPSGAGARTYTIRFGAGTLGGPQPNNATLNRDAGGAFAMFGGRMVSAMRIIEIGA